MSSSKLHKGIYLILLLNTAQYLTSYSIFNGNVYPSLGLNQFNYVGLNISYMSNSYRKLTIKETTFKKGSFENYKVIEEFEYNDDESISQYTYRTQVDEYSPVIGNSKIKYSYEEGVLVSAINQYDQELFQIQKYNIDEKIESVYIILLYGNEIDCEKEAVEFEYFYNEDGSVHSIKGNYSEYLFKNGFLTNIYSKESFISDETDLALRETSLEYYSYDLNGNKRIYNKTKNYKDNDGNFIISQEETWYDNNGLTERFIRRNKGVADQEWYFQYNYDDLNRIQNINILYENQYIVGNYLYTYVNENDYSITYYDNYNEKSFMLNIQIEE